MSTAHLMRAILEASSDPLAGYKAEADLWLEVSGATLTDLSANGHTLSGDWGVSGTAYTLNGTTQYAHAAAAVVRARSSAVTIGAWVNLASQAGTYQWVFGTSLALAGVAAVRRISTGELWAFFRGGDSYVVGPVIPLSEWAWISVVMSPSPFTFSLRVNNSILTPTPTEKTWDASTGLTAGAWKAPATPIHYTAGSYRVALSIPRALSASEIVTIANETLPVGATQIS